MSSLAPFFAIRWPPNFFFLGESATWSQEDDLSLIFSNNCVCVHVHVHVHVQVHVHVHVNYFILMNNLSSISV